MKTNKKALDTVLNAKNLVILCNQMFLLIWLNHNQVHWTYRGRRQENEWRSRVSVPAKHGQHYVWKKSTTLWTWFQWGSSLLFLMQTRLLQWAKRMNDLSIPWPFFTICQTYCKPKYPYKFTKYRSAGSTRFLCLDREVPVRILEHLQTFMFYAMYR